MSVRMFHRDLRGLVKAAMAAGWSVDVTTSGHARFRSPDGVTTVIAGRTPGDKRAIKNVRSSLERAGLRE